MFVHAVSIFKIGRGVWNRDNLHCLIDTSLSQTADQAAGFARKIGVCLVNNLVSLPGL
jgi:hypothetical protein